MLSECVLKKLVIAVSYEWTFSNSSVVQCRLPIERLVDRSANTPLIQRNPVLARAFRRTANCRHRKGKKIDLYIFLVVCVFASSGGSESHPAGSVVHAHATLMSLRWQR